MIKKLLVCLFCISVIGCAQKPLVNINAMSAGKSVGKNYVIIPARQELWDTKQLEYTQIVREVAASLSVMGYRLVDKPENADQAILLDFNRSGAVSSTRNVTVPIYGQTGISSSTTYGTANTTLSGFGYGNATANTTANSTTVYNPTYGITGAYNTTVTDTFYGAGVMLQSYDSRAFLKEKQSIMLWKSGASWVSTYSDTIADFKGLARIAASYADRNTDGDVSLRVDPKSPN